MFLQIRLLPCEETEVETETDTKLKYKVDTSPIDISLATPGNTFQVKISNYYVSETKHLLANDDGSDSDLNDFVTGDSSSDEEDWQSAVGGMKLVHFIEQKFNARKSRVLCG